MSWSEEEKMIVRTLAADPRKLTAAQIIVEGGLNRTRNAVIGFCGRNKIRLQASRNKEEPRPNIVPLFSLRVKVPPTDTAPFHSLLTAREHECRHMTGGIAPDGTPTICGRENIDGRNYCIEHSRIYYQPIRGRI